jgi:hypothetical protein
MSHHLSHAMPAVMMMAAQVASIGTQSRDVDVLDAEE